MLKNETPAGDHLKVHSMDTENTTFGCKHCNPTSCRNHSLGGVCAFVNADNVCRKPPRTWVRMFQRQQEELKAQEAAVSTH